MLKKKMISFLQKSAHFRNNHTMGTTPLKKNQVNLEYWDFKTNLGDCLAPIIVDWMLERKNINANKKVSKTKHLYAVGSVIGMGRYFDATIWGSGIHTQEAINKINANKSIRKYDIRAVRGPKTADVMRKAGYECPAVYGDPAILMPLIYNPKHIEKRYDVSVIHHYLKKNDNKDNSIHELDIETDDYEFFIDEICKSKLVISSSLHGIILAESYGVPCVFLNEGLDEELFKFYDWYNSTGRVEIKMARSIEEALKMDPMKVPDLTAMQKKLIKAFPYDIWE